MNEIIDFVIITALDIERNAMISYIPNLERVVNRGRIYYKGKIYNGEDKHISVVILSLPYMGNVNASIVTTQAIGVWNPRYIILTGITGGLESDALHLGDLIIGEQIVYYELGKKNNIGDIPRYQVQQSSVDLLNFAHDLKSNDWLFDIKVQSPIGNTFYPRAHFGVVATGEKVISNEKFGKDLLSVWPKALGIEMEAYGTALAAFQSETRPGFLFIKSICDWANSNKNDEWQFYSAHVAAAYTYNLLKSIISSTFNLNRGRKQAQRAQERNLTGRNKICICHNLLDDWHDLADYFDIPPHTQRRFVQGRECKDIWEWLESRNKLNEIMEALKFIGREDLLRCLQEM